LVCLEQLFSLPRLEKNRMDMKLGSPELVWAFLLHNYVILVKFLNLSKPQLLFFAKYSITVRITRHVVGVQYIIAVFIIISQLYFLVPCAFWFLIDRNGLLIFASLVHFQCQGYIRIQ
jgi:hypothetical protein